LKNVGKGKNGPVTRGSGGMNKE
jgi:hypothetical protein